MATVIAVPIPNHLPTLIPPPFPSPAIHIHSIVRKDDSPIGIKMEQKLPDRKILIRGIDEKSPLALSSGAQVGQEILMVNGSRVNSTSMAATLIRSTPVQGTVTLVTADPTRSPLYKLVTLPPTSVRWTSVRDGTLVRVSRMFAKSESLAEGDLLLAIQGRPVSTLEEAHRAMRSACESNNNESDVVSFYTLDSKWLRDRIWKALVQNIRANRYKELLGESVLLQPIPDTFEDRSDVQGIFIHQRLKARVVFDSESYRMVDLWQYWSARYVNGQIEHESPMEYHRNSYRKVLAVIREYNRILEHNLRQLEELVCQECWRSSMGDSSAVARAPIVAEVASFIEEEQDGDDGIPLATATYF